MAPRKPFSWMAPSDAKDDLLYDYARELKDLEDLEDPSEGVQERILR